MRQARIQAYRFVGEGKVVGMVEVERPMLSRVGLRYTINIDEPKLSH
jgi:hypothetical protein